MQASHSGDTMSDADPESIPPNAALIERVAIAIHGRSSATCEQVIGLGHPAWDKSSDGSKRYYRTLAVAAITEIEGSLA